MDGVLPIVFLAVVLKIPVFFAIWLVWWAVRAEPELEDASDDAGDHSFRRWRRTPAPPRGPRRGPHGGAARALPDCPPAGRRRTVAPGRPVPAIGPHERHQRSPAPAESGVRQP
jgi:hypothetical protein